MTKMLTLKRRKPRITKQQIEIMRECFLMDGVTVNGAATMADVDNGTARSYFDEWSEELIESDNHLTWEQRQNRAKARALEGVTKRIISVRQGLTYLQAIYDSIILEKKNKLKNVFDIDHELVVKYEGMIRQNTILLDELTTESHMIQMMIPAAAILDKEVELILAQKYESLAKPN